MKKLLNILILFLFATFNTQFVVAQGGGGLAPLKVAIVADQSDPLNKAISNKAVCADDDIFVFVVAEGGPGNSYKFTWTSEPAGLGSKGSSNGFLINCSNAGEYKLTAKVKDKANREDSATISVTIHPLPPQNDLEVIDGTNPFCAGGSVTLSEPNTATNLSYEWWSQEYHPIDPGNQKSQKFDKAGTYYVLVIQNWTNAEGVVTATCMTESNPTTVVVNELPEAAAGPDDVCEGAPLDLQAGPDGMNSYTWTGPNGFNKTEQNPHVADAATTTHAGNYTVQVEDANGCKNSATTNVHVVNMVTAGTIGSDQNICYNTAPELLTSVVDAANNPTYQWQQKEEGATSFTVIPGANEATYQPGPLTKNTTFKRVATNACGTDESNEVTITVGPELHPGEIEADQDICFNTQPAELTEKTAATGGSGAPFTYQWQQKEDGAADFVDIPGATNTTYQPPALTKTTEYQRLLVDACGTVPTASVKITVYEQVSGGTIGSDQTICHGSVPVAFTSNADAQGGKGTFTYQWEQKPATADWSDILGETNSTYSPGSLTETTSFRRKATDVCGTEFSNEITVTVLDEITKFNVTGGGKFCASAALLEVGLNGSQTGVNYVLVKDGVATTTALDGTGAALSFGTIAEGGTYTVKAQLVADNTCAEDMNGNAVLELVDEISGNNIKADQTISSGDDPAQLQSDGTLIGGGNSYVYQWQESTNGTNFVDITSAAAETYDPPALTETHWYKRVVTSSASTCQSESNELKITVLDKIDNNTVEEAQEICYNATPTQLVGSQPVGGQEPYTYQWQVSTDGINFGNIDGANGKDYQPGNLTADTWYRRMVSCVVVTATNISEAVKITVRAELKVSIGEHQDLTCNGQNDGSAKVQVDVASLATATYTYKWNTTPEQTTETATNLPAGAVQVLVTDDIGCTATADITLTQPDALELDGTPQITAVTGCFGDENGQLKVKVKGGTPDYIYALAGPSTPADQTPSPATNSAQFSDLKGGTYTLTVTDAKGCVFTTDGIEITQPDPITFDYTQTDVKCDGTLGSITFTNLQGGTPPYKYSIDNGVNWQDDATFPDLAQGDFTLKVKDANDCESEAKAITVKPADEIKFDVENIHVSGCFGGDNGVIHIKNVSGGTAPYQYSVKTPPEWVDSPDFLGLVAGVYTVQVVDAEACTGNATVMINQPTEIEIKAFVTDVEGCFDEANGAIKVTAKGGTAPYQYSIDAVNFQAEKVFNGLSAGDYTVTVRDANGCEKTEVVTVNAPEAIVIDFTEITNVDCFSKPTGSVKYKISGGTPPYKFSFDGVHWSSADSVIDGLTAGDYILYVKDKNGCLADKDFTLTQPPWFYFGTISPKNITCNGANNGVIEVIGTPINGEPFDYILFGPGVADTLIKSGPGLVIFDNLKPGTYTLSIGKYGCTMGAGNFITMFDPPALEIKEVTHEDPRCFGDNNGKITVVGGGGNKPFTFELHGDEGLIKTFKTVGSDSIAVFNDLAPGIYSVKLTDVNNCGPVEQTDIVIAERPELTIAVSKTDITCNGDGDGSITINASGGSGAGYEYSLNGAEFIALDPNPLTINSLTKGTYVVVVRDGNGCESTSETLQIEEPDALTLVIELSNIKCNGDGSGQIKVTASGGSGIYDYELSADGFTTQTNNTGVFDNLGSGEYTISVSDGGGCTTDSVVQIVEPEAITITSNSHIDIVCGSNNDGSITVEASGGTAPLTFKLMSGGMQVQANETGVFEGLAAGDYIVQVTDANSCGPVSTPTITIAEPDPLEIVSVTATDISTCAGDETGEINIVASGGTVPLEYSIDGGETYRDYSNFTNLAAGKYQIVVKDANGCQEDYFKPVTILEPDPIEIIKVVLDNPTAIDACDGKITVKASGGTGTLTFTLLNDDDATFTKENNDGKFADLCAGSYNIKVVDDNNCEVDSGSFVIRGHKVDYESTPVTCYGGNDGTITLTIEGGFPPFKITSMSVKAVSPNPEDIEFVSQNPPTNSIYKAEGLFADTIIVLSVTDSMGKDLKGFPLQFNILQPKQLVAQIDTRSPSCWGDTTGQINFAITGGDTLHPYTIAWLDTSITTDKKYVDLPAVYDSIQNVVGGKYQFTVTDANNCTTDPSPIDVHLVNPDPIKLDVNIVQERPYNGQNGIVEVKLAEGETYENYILVDTVKAITDTSTLQIFNHLGPSVYYIQVVDDQGCMGFSDTFEIRGTNINLLPYDVSCNAAANGGFNLDIEHGFSPFTVTYNNIPVEPAATADGKFTYKVDSVLAVGDYTLQVVDQTNQTHTLPFTISQPEPLTVDIAKIDALRCAEDATGKVTFNIQGGTPGYTIAWDDRTSTENSVSGLVPGDYNFVVTDANGCPATPATLNVTLNAPKPIVMDTNLLHPACYGQAMGTIELIPSGGTGAFTFKLNSEPPVGNGRFDNLKAGNYHLVVTDSLGCTKSYDFTLRDTTPIQITRTSIYTETMDCPYENDGFVTVSVTGGYGGYRYIWPSLGDEYLNRDSVGGLAPGTYPLIVVDQADCMVSDTFSIKGPPQFVFDSSLVTMADCRNFDSISVGTLSVSGSGGNPGAIRYSLINEQFPFDTITKNAPNFINLPAGNYIVMAYDSKGCRYEKLDTIPVKSAYDFSIQTPDSTVCFAKNIELKASALFGPKFDHTIGLRYEWYEQDSLVNTDSVYYVNLPEARNYEFRVRATFDREPYCFDERLAHINVYPDIGLHVPIYIPSVQNDTIVSVLLGNEYNLDVSTLNIDFPTTFRWYPPEMFSDSTSWNTSVILTQEVYDQISSQQPERFVEMIDPQTNKLTEYLIAHAVATTDVGCIDTLKLYTKIVKRLYLSSVFSPNGDGRNDVWRIPKSYLFPDMEVEIYNRWGSLVWSAKGEKAAHGWDGRTNNGKALPIGTYWYVIKFNNEGSAWKPETGSVTIVK